MKELANVNSDYLGIPKSFNFPGMDFVIKQENVYYAFQVSISGKADKIAESIAKFTSPALDWECPDEINYIFIMKDGVLRSQSFGESPLHLNLYGWPLKSAINALGIGCSDKFLKSIE